MERTRFVALALLSTAWGCAPAAPPPDDALATLRAAAEAYQAAAAAKDAEGVVGLYDASALMIPPGDELVEGLDGVRGYRFGFIETPGVSLEFELLRAEVAASGDLGWTVAEGRITIRQDDGPPTREVVRDVHTWRRQADGSWKVVVDVWNAGVPPAG